MLLAWCVFCSVFVVVYLYIAIVVYLYIAIVVYVYIAIALLSHAYMQNRFGRPNWNLFDLEFLIGSSIKSVNQTLCFIIWFLLIKEGARQQFIYHELQGTPSPA